MTGLGDRLAAVVGAEHVLADEDVRAAYEHDWKGTRGGAALLAVRPGSTGEVAGVLRCCSEAGVAVVPRGGNTGLAGGALPRGGEVVLSLERLRAVGPVEVADALVEAEAGVTLARLQEHVRPEGLDFGVDLGARDAATVGGMIATNAGGIHAFRHGTMRAQVRGIEAVLADGTVVRRLTGVLKDNAGYDLPGLLAGSEGTLAVVTRARLRLVPFHRARATVLVALASVDAGVRLLGVLLARVPALDAVEIFGTRALELVCASACLPRPFPRPYPAYVLVEAAAHDDPLDQLVAALDHTDAVDSVVAADAAGRERLWAYRELMPEAMGRQAPSVHFDICLPRSGIAVFEKAIQQVLRSEAAGAGAAWLGHLGDGNLHVGIWGLAGDRAALERRLLQLTVSLGGSVSAEHGVGTRKVHMLPWAREPADLAVMQALKRALDPQGILNPGVLFPAAPSS